MQSLEAAGVREGQRVLIHAGAGGVGSFAVQLAKARGAHVITTAGPRNVDFVQKAPPCCSLCPLPPLINVTDYDCTIAPPSTQHAGCQGLLQCIAEGLHHGWHHSVIFRLLSAACTVNRMIVQELGADEAIDYTSTRFEEVLKSHPVDAVIDPMAGGG